TPQGDLFAIEHTNRDTINPAPPAGTGTGTRFNVPPQCVAPNVDSTTLNIAALAAPQSYGKTTGHLPTAQPPGVRTLPGAIALFKHGRLVGGIGLFVAGTTGYACGERSKLNTPVVTAARKPDLSEVAEYIAVAAAGGSPAAGVPLNGPLNGAPPLRKFA